MPRIAFGAPELLPMVLLAVLAAGLFVWVLSRKRAARARYRGTSMAALVSAATSPGRQVFKAALVVLVILLLALAAARPQIGTHKTLLQREGTDVIVALDVSLSMSAQDAKPSRLERAKGALGALFDHLQGDRVGLVTFAGSAELRFPLTTDVEAARKVVQGLTFKDGGLRAGTSIGEALRQATEGFANDNTRSKILVLVSDGEDLGDDATGAATFVQSQGIALDTIGIGQDSPVPVLVLNPRTGLLESRTDPTTSQALLTSADPKALQQLANSNKGHFFDGNSDDYAVQLDDEIGRLQKTRFETGEGDVPLERYQILAGIALAMLMLDYMLPAGRRRKVGSGGRWLSPVLRRIRGADRPAAAAAPVDSHIGVNQ